MPQLAKFLKFAELKINPDPLWPVPYREQKGHLSKFVYSINFHQCSIFYIFLLSINDHKCQIENKKDTCQNSFIQSTFTNVPFSLMYVTYLRFIYIFYVKQECDIGRLYHIHFQFDMGLYHILQGCIISCSGRINDKCTYKSSKFTYEIIFKSL